MNHEPSMIWAHLCAGKESSKLTQNICDHPCVREVQDYFFFCWCPCASGCFFFSKEGVNRLWILVCQLPGLYTFYLKSEPSVLGVSLPSPMAYCTQRLSVLWFALPHHMTSLKVPPPFSLFISSKLFEMRGVSQSQTSFPSTTACLRICQRGLRRAFFFFVRMCVCAKNSRKNLKHSYSRFPRDWEP